MIYDWAAKQIHSTNTQDQKSFPLSDQKWCYQLLYFSNHIDVQYTSRCVASDSLWLKHLFAEYDRVMIEFASVY